MNYAEFLLTTDSRSSTYLTICLLASPRKRLPDLFTSEERVSGATWCVRCRADVLIPSVVSNIRPAPALVFVMG